MSMSAEIAVDKRLTREQPTHERHRADRHAHSKNDAGQHPLGIAFTESEHEPAHKGPSSTHDGDVDCLENWSVVPRSLLV